MHYIINLLIIFSSYGQVKKIAELETKQASNNLRYVSSDGKVTYYQNRSGTLSYSTNYSNLELIKSPKHTQYSVHVSNSKKKVLVSADETYYSKMNFNKLKSIYIIDYAKEKAKEIGKGVDPQLHLNDLYASFYNPNSKLITLYNTSTKTKKSFKVFNNLAPFFRPKVELITTNELLFTDINKSGETAILNYSFISKKFIPVFKSKLKNSHLNFCINNQKAIVFESSANNLKPQTNIYTIDLFNNDSFKKRNLIYSSIFNDIGNLLCNNNSIFFIKTIGVKQNLNSQTSDIVKIDLQTNILKRFESDINPTQLLKMDSLILTPKNGKLFLVEGNNTSLINDTIVKDKE